MDVGDWRGGLVHSRVFDWIAEQGFGVLLQFRIRVLQHRLPIHNTEQVNRRCPDIGSLADRHQCHEPAVGGAGNSYLLRTDVTRRLEKPGCVNFVLEISAPEVLIVGALKVHSVSSRSPHIWRDANVAA